jgi:hypothetical protein
MIIAVRLRTIAEALSHTTTAATGKPGWNGRGSCRGGGGCCCSETRTVNKEAPHLHNCGCSRQPLPCRIVCLHPVYFCYLDPPIQSIICRGTFTVTALLYLQLWMCEKISDPKSTTSIEPLIWAGLPLEASHNNPGAWAA